MSTSYAADVGDLVTLRIELRDPAGVLTDPTTVTLRITTPDGVVGSALTYPTQVQRSSVGIYYYQYPVVQMGDHVQHWTTGGTLVADEEAIFSVSRRLPPPPPLIVATHEVEQALGHTVTDKDRLMRCIQDAEEWINEVYGRAWGRTASVTESFFNVDYHGILHLMDRNPSAFAVSAFLAPDSAASVLTLNSQYHYIGKGRIQLLHANVEPFVFWEYGIPDRYGRMEYARVEVSYTGSGDIPRPVREAVILIAGSNYERTPNIIGGIESEHIGDYSYNLASGEKGALELVIPEAARSRLRAFRRGGQVRST